METDDVSKLTKILKLLIATKHVKSNQCVIYVNSEVKLFWPKRSFSEKFFLRNSQKKKKSVLTNAKTA